MRLSLTSTLMMLPIVALAACNPGPASAEPPPPAPAAPVSAAAAPAAVQTSTGAPAQGAQRRRPNADGSMMAPPQPMTLEQMLQRSLMGFDRLDADHDGALTTAEIDAGTREGGPGGQMMRRADADSDGRVTKAEVEAGVRARFQRMDANGDGLVSPEERPQRPGGRR